MFQIVPFENSFSCKTLQLCSDVFHQALKLGEKRYHVVGENGQSKYDIVYIDNNRLEPRHPGYVKGETIPRYFSYNEYDKQSIYLDFFMNNGITCVFIEDNETFYIQKAFKCGMEDNNFKRLSSIYAFHNLFFLQWLTNGESVKKINQPF